MKSVIRSILAVIMLALIVSATLVPAAAAQTGQGPAAGGGLSSAPSVVLTSAVAAASGSGDTTAWTIDELGISVNIPNYLYVLSRNMAVDDPTPAVFGLDRDAVIKYFKEHDIYLNAIAAKVIYEINITMYQPPEAQKIWNLDTLTDEDADALIQDSAALYRIVGYKYGASEIYTGNPGEKFIKSDFTIGDNTFGTQFFTVRDGKAINIVLTSYSEKLLEQQTPMVTKIVDTLTFTKPAAPSPSASPSAQTSPSASPSSAAVTSSGAVTSPSVPQSPSAAPSADSQKGAAGGILAGLSPYIPYAVILAATFVLLTVPMLIYRFAVLKHRLPRGKALKIAGLYGLAFAVVAAAYIFFFKGSILAVAGVVLWSVVNFFILSCGKGETEDADDSLGLYPMILTETRTEKKQTGPDANPAVNKICKNCFAVNLATSKICFYCGAKLEDDETADKTDT
jgi:hypothetical protein